MFDYSPNRCTKILCLKVNLFTRHHTMRTHNDLQNALINFIFFSLTLCLFLFLSIFRSHELQLLFDQWRWCDCIHSGGEINNGYLTDAVSIASRKSLNLQPVLLVGAPPHHMATANGDDSISQFSNRTSSRYNRPDFHNSMHHFQL